MNAKGHRETLRASHPENQNALREGVYSARVLAPRAREVADALMTMPHVMPLDRLAAEEVGGLVALREAIDRDLEARGLTNKRGEPRGLVALRIRVSGRLERWARELLATPASRIGLAGELARGDAVSAAVRAQLEEGARLVDQARADQPPRVDQDG